MQVTVEQSDIEKVWRPLTTEEAALVPGLSNRAWIRIRARFPDIETNTAPVPPATEPLVSVDLVMDVMASMIVRVLKNPESLRVRSESIDDHTDAATLDAAISSGEMYLTEDEAALLTPRAEVPVYGMYVLGLGGV
ncbi:hypothetical protein [Pseudarthrobacter sp. BRE9]|uniref:hypothetical protein n=1 Tax=Pseudarthrobacter sp. BRE9 TaxID=2962582 RepID=UPI0028823BB8|nr:hypothetical protein [Pseudarthrobacter sp. BRE9]MDT0171027.1 hypothetical protein [Pseudarthrobacter sp. BRE9]